MEPLETDVLTATVETFATAAGLLPERLPGDYLHPIKLNQTTWQLRAAMARNRWALDTQITKDDFDAAISESLNASAR